ncbi:MAG: Wzz/FepE/Etk N-terminal domain-containing protein [Clostridiales bacterium]|nr:Wzz/FepE/Etk N-terminal domain-containing protein [Clostridiales bacterium]
MERRGNQRPGDSQVMEIDLLELFLELKRRWLIILIAAILCGGGVGAYSKFVITPQYESTAMMYILSKETTLASLADLQIGTQLTKDYQVIVVSRPVLEEVVETLNLGITYRELREKITLSNPTDTRILSITVQDPSPHMAKRIVDQISVTASNYIGEIMEMVPPKIIETGEVPQMKSSPSNGRNAAIGALIGIALVCGWVSLEVILNDTIQTEEDVTRYLDLAVLASVPERAGGDDEDSGKSKKKKKKKTGRGRQ